jgi:putative membrane protein
MKTSFLLILSIVLFLGCNSGSNTANSDTTAMTDDMTADNTMNNNSTWDQDKIKNFVDKASQGGMQEVALGKEAQKKALSQDVKDFGKMMETDHSKANDQLKTAVAGLGLTIPADMDKDHMDKIEKFGKKSGKTFDKDYIDDMVSDHKEDVDEFEDAQNNLPSGELKTWVDNTLPVLRQHLIRAQTIQDQLKNSK